MTGLRVAHTADLSDADLRAVRRLLEDAFADAPVTEDDLEHALGGVHALVEDAGVLVAHGAVVQRRLLHGGRALRSGYLEAVAVRSDRRRRGHGSAVMAALERVVRRAYDLGALGSTDEGAPLYAGRGWQPWRGPLSALTPGGLRPTPDERGSIYVLPGAARLDLDGELTCDWRDGDVW